MLKPRSPTPTLPSTLGTLLAGAAEPKALTAGPKVHFSKTANGAKRRDRNDCDRQNGRPSGGGRARPNRIDRHDASSLQITGTARGNGRELAWQFHRLGARVVCVDKDGAGNGETVDSIRADGGQAVGYTVDITDRKRLAGMHADVRRRMGPVDVLVNNAAVVQRSTLFADPAADDAVAETINTNLLGQIRVKNVFFFHFPRVCALNACRRQRTRDRGSRILGPEKLAQRGEETD